ncbi:MAG: hypothetical protein ABI419_08475 [Ginsengibacter sp.]
MKYFFTILFIACISISYSQKFTISADAQLAVPEGDYKDANPDAGYGLRANFLFRPGKSRFVKLGLELGMQEKARATQYFSGYINGFYDDFKVSATSNIFSLMFLTRLQPNKFGKVKPFVDLTAGWNVFFSTVSVERLTYFSDYNSSYSNSTKAHWAFSYGAAGGIDIPLSKRDDLGLELKVAYIIGANTSYLTDPYIDNNAQVSFFEKNSRTNMLIPQAGLRINL